MIWRTQVVLNLCSEYPLLIPCIDHPASRQSLGCDSEGQEKLMQGGGLLTPNLLLLMAVRTSSYDCYCFRWSSLLSLFLVCSSSCSYDDCQSGGLGRFDWSQYGARAFCGPLHTQNHSAPPAATAAAARRGAPPWLPSFVRLCYGYESSFKLAKKV